MAKILIVDDNDDNREVLCDALADAGHVLATACDGVEALASVFDEPPDLILLDVMMPTMNGIECCRRLKTDETTRHIPVILITALSEDHDVLDGLQAGASDYIAKPFAGPVVRARVESALRAKLAHDELKERNLEVRELVKVLAQKNTKLAQLTSTAHRFVDNVAHEFRTPLAVIKEFTSIITDGLGGPVTEKQVGYLEFIDRATHDLSQMVDDFLDSSKLKAGTLRVDRRAVTVEEIIEPVLPILETRAAQRRITIRHSIAAGLGSAFADAEKARRVIVNLVVNAIKFSPEGSEVEVRAERDGKAGARIEVSDRGPGLSAEDLAQAFRRFRQTGDAQRSSSKGFGLGLDIARELVWLNLGALDVRSAPGKGSVFSFTLPPCDPAAVLDKYLERIKEMDELPIRIAALEAVPAAPGAAIEPLRRFLVSECHPTDVVLPRQDGMSIVVVGSTTEPDAWIRRLKAAWASPSRNATTPDVDFGIQRLGTWAIGEAAAIGPLLSTPATTELARA